MKKIQCFKDLKILFDEFPTEFLDYLGCKFNSLYEYLSNGKGIEKFLLENYQAMIIVEEPDEFDLIIKNRLELEYVEEVQLCSTTCLKIGVLKIEDIQLHYFLKG